MEIQRENMLRYGQPVFGDENRTQAMRNFGDKEKTYKVYPILGQKPDQELTKFDSVILNEEIEGFDTVGSMYTDDILITLQALN